MNPGGRGTASVQRASSLTSSFRTQEKEFQKAGSTSSPFLVIDLRTAATPCRAEQMRLASPAPSKLQAAARENGKSLAVGIRRLGALQASRRGDGWSEEEVRRRNWSQKGA